MPAASLEPRAGACRRSPAGPRIASLECWEQLGDGSSGGEGRPIPGGEHVSRAPGEQQQSDGASASLGHGSGPKSRESDETDPVSRELGVRPYRAGDEKALVEVYSSLFRERSMAEWRWMFQQGPDGPADIGILESDDRVVGSIAHLPVAVWVGGRQLRLAIGCDLMITPECRGLRGSEQLVRAFLASEHGFDLNLGTVNESSSHVMGRYAGTVTMGRPPQWVRLRTRGGRHRALVRLAATTAERFYGTVSSWPSPNLAVVDLVNLGPEVDDLARESAGFAPCIRVRDAAYLRWRWLEEPATRWRIRAARDADGGLRGLAVFGARGDGLARRGIVADLLARDAPAVRALAIDAWTILVADGCHSVTCTYLDPRPWARRAMFRSGFRPTRGPMVACGPLSPSAGSEVGRLESWYLTYGDTVSISSTETP